MSKFFKGFSALAVSALPQLVMAQGGAIESSPRPMARPDLGVIEQVQTTANAGFNRWIVGFRARAQAKGISARVLDNAFRGIRYNTDVIAKDRHQSEFTKQIWDYLDSAASPTRVKNGQEALRKHGRTLEQIEARYGVDKEVVAAVWGLESAYGERRGEIPIIEALATLAYDGRRGKFFEAQLIAALKIRRCGAARDEGIMGRGDGAYAVYPDLLFGLCG
jgi:membrane-bound lytic murein transglycosylase B